MSRLVRFSNNPVCQQMEAISLFVRLSVIFFSKYPCQMSEILFFGVIYINER